MRKFDRDHKTISQHQQWAKALSAKPFPFFSSAPASHVLLIMQKKNEKILRSLFIQHFYFNLILLGLAMAVKSTINYYFFSCFAHYFRVSVWISNFHAICFGLLCSDCRNEKRRVFYYQILRQPINHVTSLRWERKTFTIVCPGEGEAKSSSRVMNFSAFSLHFRRLFTSANCRAYNLMKEADDRQLNEREISKSAKWSISSLRRWSNLRLLYITRHFHKQPNVLLHEHNHFYFLFVWFSFDRFGVKSIMHICSPRLPDGRTENGN